MYSFIFVRDKSILKCVSYESQVVFMPFLLVALSTVSFGQNVKLITVDQLQERMKNGKDSTYVVNFWATWCAPCVKELPHFEKLQAEYKTEKLAVLLVSVDFKSKLNSAVIPFVKRKNMKNEVFLLNESSPQEYIDRIDPSWSGSIPATLFIKDDKRKFVETELTYEQLLTEYKKL
ncbi:TlpA family protein disulfide reductase [Flavobacterium sp. P21]|uniref:TlpA family protein disulfide reductase n=1 Tax=Flavobacterium sp. P21 TaxID=3423948 RepID=UPI003D67309F